MPALLPHLLSASSRSRTRAHGYILSPLLSRTPRRHLPAAAAFVLRALPPAAADASSELSFAPLEIIRTIGSVSAPALSLPPLCDAVSEALPRRSFVAALSSASDGRRLAALQLASYEDFKAYFSHSAKSSEPTYVKTLVDVVLGLYKQVRGTGYYLPSHAELRPANSVIYCRSTGLRSSTSFPQRSPPITSTLPPPSRGSSSPSP